MRAGYRDARRSFKTNASLVAAPEAVLSNIHHVDGAFAWDIPASASSRGLS
jgi:hypothetical protein